MSHLEPAKALPFEHAASNLRESSPWQSVVLGIKRAYSSVTLAMVYEG